MSYLDQILDDPLFYWIARDKAHRIRESTRKTGIFLMGASGSGKTLTASRGISFPDFKQEIPQVLFDTVGALIDDFLFITFSELEQLRRRGAITLTQEKKILRRIRYLDMSGRTNGRVSKWPLYYRQPNESYSDASARLIDIFGLLDPALSNAPIHGMNALVHIAKPVGIVLTALGYGITEAYELLTLPKRAFQKKWVPRLQALKAETSAREVRQAVDFFLNDFLALSGFEKDRLISSFLAKLSLFDDDSMQAMYGASEPSLDWSEVVARKQTVLLDFRHETNPLKRRFKMLHCYFSFRDFVIRRGVHERANPVGLVLEELPELFAFDLQGDSKVVAKEITKLLDEYGRNKNIWLTLICQHAAQIDETSFKSLLGRGTVAIGRVADYETAERLSKDFFPIDPYKIKRFDYTYLQDGPVFQHILGDHLRYTPAPQYGLYPTNPVEFSPQEQLDMNARHFMNRGLFKFLVKTSEGEGDKPQALKWVDFSQQFKGKWVNEDIAAYLRQMLWKYEGAPTEEVLDEIDTRLGIAKTIAKKDQLPVIEAADEEVVPELAKATVHKPSTQGVLAAFDAALEVVQNLPPETWQLP